MSAQYQFTLQRVEPDVSLAFTIDGQNHIFNSGTLVYSLSFVDGLSTCLFCGEVSFVDSNIFDISLQHSGNSFNFSFYNGRNNPSFEFIPVSLIGCSFYYDDYTLDDEYNVSVGGSTVDLTPVLNGISTLQNQLNSLSFPQTDLTPVLTKLDNLNYPDIDINAFNFYSLNGNCGSLPDGTLVTVTGLEGDFEVSSSQFTWNDSTAQMSMIMYKLSKDGSFCLVPDVYVTKKV